MNGFLNFFTGTLNTVAWIYILLPCVFIGGIIFTIGNKGIQFSHFGYVMKNTIGKMFKHREAGEGAVTPLQAVTTALAATVGTGNIVGTAQAISMGGYGAVFWLWIAALLGMVIKYSEVTLSLNFREKNKKGDWVGGPMYYIKNGLSKKWRWLAYAFAIFAALAAFGIGNMSQANSITGSLNDLILAFNPEFTGMNAVCWVVGIVLAFTTGLVLLGGIKRIGSVTEKLIPIMSLLYIIISLVVIFGHIENIGNVFKLIFTAAFNTKAVMGAASGIVLKNAIVWGLRRSAFSNEAGLGSAGIAHSASTIKHPVVQGFYGIFEVFMDTIVICSLTAITIIISGVDIEWGVKPGSSLITAAFSTILGPRIASLFVAIALMLFAYSTILGWSLYGVRCTEFLFGEKAGRPYQLIFILVIIVGCVSPVSIVWDLADTLNGLMAIPNFIALFLLSPVVFRLTREHFEGERLENHK